jgi:hypothetical protein
VLFLLLFGLLLLSDLVQGLEGTEFGESDLGDPSEDFLSSHCCSNLTYRLVAASVA